MKVLVTGGAGFIGSHLVDALLDRGDEVVVLDDLSTGLRRSVPGAAIFLEGSITDETVLRAAVRQCDAVFHQAAAGAVMRSVADPVRVNDINVAGTLKVLTAARDAGVTRTIIASSSSVYGGASGDVPVRESDPLMPRSPYAVTKMASEQYTRVFGELFGMETVVLRYFNVFGPRQRPDSQYAAVVPLFVDALRRGGTPEVHGDGLQSRDFTYVTDVVQANLLALDADAATVSGHIYNVARGEQTTLLQLLAMLEDLSGRRMQSVHMVARAGDIRQSRADIDAARRDLGYEPTVDVRTGLRHVLEWAERAGQ